MTTIHDSRPTKSDSIAAHRYALPIVWEISPAAAASRDEAPAPQTPSTVAPSPRAARAQRRLPADAGDIERVVMAASAGDRTAVSELVERFGARVRTVARVHRLAAHDVEDVMQTTWLRLLEHVDTIRDPNAVGAWLETTARRESLRVLRASSRERPTDSELVLDAPVPPVDEQRMRAAERRSALAVALEQLTGHRRELLSMLFADPAPSYAEISRALAMPIGSIGPTRARCLARLRENQDLGDLADTVGNRAASDAHPCIAGVRSHPLPA